MLEFNESTFADAVDKSDKPIVLDFYANWCGPCKMLSPKFQEWSVKYGDKALFGKVNIDDAHSLAAEYNVAAIPTVVIVKDSKEVKRWVGLPTEEDIKKALGA